MQIFKKILVYAKSVCFTLYCFIIVLTVYIAVFNLILRQVGRKTPLKVSGSLEKIKMIILQHEEALCYSLHLLLKSTVVVDSLF